MKKLILNLSSIVGLIGLFSSAFADTEYLYVKYDTHLSFPVFFHASSKIHSYSKSPINAGESAKFSLTSHFMETLPSGDITFTMADGSSCIIHMGMPSSDNQIKQNTPKNSAYSCVRINDTHYSIKLKSPSE